MKPPPLTVIAGCLLLASSAGHAALLAYEPFDYAAGTQLQGAGGAELGFDPGSTWRIENNGPFTSTATEFADVLDGGMTFGDLQVAGNRGRYSTTDAGTETKAVMRDIDFSISGGGTLWMSYLLRPNASDNSTGRGMAIFDNVGSRDFTVLGKRNATTGAGVVGYESAVQNTAAGLDLSTPYMIVSRFDNVGAGAGGGTATMWMVSESEFATFDDDSFITVGELDSIDASRIASASDSGSTPSVNADGTLGIVTVDTTSTSRHAWWFDELRVGTTLNDVTPIPEPSSSLLVLIAAAGLAIRIRHR